MGGGDGAGEGGALTVAGDAGRTWWERRWLEAVGAAFGPGWLDRGAARLGEGAAHEVTYSAGRLQVAVRDPGRPVGQRVTFWSDPVSPERWAAFVRERPAPGAWNEVGPAFERRFAAAGLPLFPQRLGVACTCPDWSHPCPHARAAALFVAADIGRDPEGLLIFRGAPASVPAGGRSPGPDAAGQGTPRTPAGAGTGQGRQPAARPAGAGGGAVVPAPPAPAAATPGLPQPAAAPSGSPAGPLGPEGDPRAPAARPAGAGGGAVAPVPPAGAAARQGLPQAAAASPAPPGMSSASPGAPGDASPAVPPPAVSPATAAMPAQPAAGPSPRAAAGGAADGVDRAYPPASPAGRSDQGAAPGATPGLRADAFWGPGPAHPGAPAPDIGAAEPRPSAAAAGEAIQAARGDLPLRVELPGSWRDTLDVRPAMAALCAELGSTHVPDERVISGIAFGFRPEEIAAASPEAQAAGPRRAAAPVRKVRLWISSLPPGTAPFPGIGVFALPGTAPRGRTAAAGAGTTGAGPSRPAPADHGSRPSAARAGGAPTGGWPPRGTGGLPEAPSPGRFCPSCGAPAPRDWRYCAKCGHVLF